mmetsp:Transcript_4723/g.16473  ORF Transcript_4723/g.16473 Transcript_4723/m.16473 type:complete len:236 (-) Transcript_4723:607-1314(-)
MLPSLQDPGNCRCGENIACTQALHRTVQRDLHRRLGYPAQFHDGTHHAMDVIHSEGFGVVEHVLAEPSEYVLGVIALDAADASERLDHLGPVEAPRRYDPDQEPVALVSLHKSHHLRGFRVFGRPDQLRHSCQGCAQRRGTQVWRVRLCMPQHLRRGGRRHDLEVVLQLSRLHLNRQPLISEGYRHPCCPYLLLPGRLHSQPLSYRTLVPLPLYLPLVHLPLHLLHPGRPGLPHA